MLGDLYSYSEPPRATGNDVQTIPPSLQPAAKCDPPSVRGMGVEPPILQRYLYVHQYSVKPALSFYKLLYDNFPDHVVPRRATAGFQQSGVLQQIESRYRYTELAIARPETTNNVPQILLN